MASEGWNERAVVKSTASALGVVIARYVKENQVCSLVVPIDNEQLHLVLIPSHDLTYPERHLRQLVPHGNHVKVLQIIASILDLEIDTDDLTQDAACVQIMTTNGKFTTIVRDSAEFS